jgi:BolA protein
VTVAEIIREKLEKAFAPSRLTIEDESHKHHGHAGHRPGIETHFNVVIVAAAFEGRPRVARHRMVMAVLADEIGNPVHALALKVLTPDEAAKVEEE